jgi:PAS domain S-box-containing protein
MTDEDPEPACEADRLAALRGTGLLDSPPEPSFDRLTRLAARLLRAPVALVSLVDEGRQFFKSSLGLPEPWASRRQTPLSHSFCRHVVASRRPLVVADARRHPLVCDNPAIAELGVVAYLGVPLVTADGHALGSFCAIDAEPRPWAEEDVEALRDLAASAVAEIELRRSHEELERQVGRRTAELRAANAALEAEVGERRRAEQALAGERGLLRAVFESLEDSIVAYDARGNPTLFNRAAQRLYGPFPAGGWAEHCDLYRADGETPMAAGETPQARAMRGEAVRDVEMVIAPRGGEPRTVLAGGRPLLDARGERIGAVVVLHDITGRRRAERERDRFFQLSVDILAIADFEGRCRRVNPAVERTLGWTEEEFLARPFFDFIHPEDRDATRAEVARTAEGSPTTHHANRYLCKDGSYRWLAWTSWPVPEEGLLYSVGRDITALKQAEQERAQLPLEQAARAEAESASRSREQFLAVLSHELRTPLTPVLVAVSALLDDPATPEPVRAPLEVARRNVELEARLIDDLLDVTHIRRGKLRLGREVADAHALVRQAIEVCRDEIAAKGLALEVDLAADAYRVEADPARLQQIAWNLIKNAAKFTPAGGRIAVRSRNEGGVCEAPRLVLEVRDSGIGIEPAVLPRIFDAFDQGDAAASGRFGGLGLGLAISRSLAEAHGGTLSAASAGRGLGATFTLVLPTVSAPAPAPAPPPGPSAVPRARALHILLVEDNADTLRVVARLLRGRGHRVTTAAGVGAALEAEGRFDLVISDIGLPDGSGLDLLRQLRSRRPVPGIALSGYGMDDDLRKSCEAGFAAHLTKPVDFRKLEETIRQVASRHESAADGG